MGSLPMIHWLNDFVACVCGIFLNLLLIWAIRMTANRNNRQYGHLVLVGALFDVLFSIVELITLHQLSIKDGKMFIMSRGPEFFLRPHVGNPFMALYSFRYEIITNSDVSVRVLLRNVGITSLLAGVMAFIGWFGTLQAEGRRGRAFYEQQVDDWWKDGDGSSHFVYAMDYRDPFTLAFFFVSLLITNVCFGASLFYAYKAWRFVHDHQTAERSARTVRMERQFTRSLVAQTICALVFAGLPISVMCTAMQFNLSIRIAGLWTMSWISWLAAANALLAIVIIEKFRTFVIKTLRLQWLAAGLYGKPLENTTAIATTNNRVGAHPSSYADGSRVDH
ncbi:hypothetical protein M3Y99_01106900 [Aphelenchoides fujianensis]|nr:hypothetical protein M3Y99_01106900 [Aphelenchoides fujianensis]